MIRHAFKPGDPKRFCEGCGERLGCNNWTWTMAALKRLICKDCRRAEIEAKVREYPHTTNLFWLRLEAMAVAGQRDEADALLAEATATNTD